MCFWNLFTHMLSGTSVSLLLFILNGVIACFYGLQTLQVYV